MTNMVYKTSLAGMVPTSFLPTLDLILHSHYVSCQLQNLTEMTSFAISTCTACVRSECDRIRNDQRDGTCRMLLYV